MNEKTAMLKWCPFARVCVVSQDGDHMTPFNRIAQDNAHVDDFRTNGPMRCIGSDCMAWRWEEPLHDGLDSYVAEPLPDGFCGLAGRPT